MQYYHLSRKYVISSAVRQTLAFCSTNSRLGISYRVVLKKPFKQLTSPVTGHNDEINNYHFMRILPPTVAKPGCSPRKIGLN